MNDRGIDEAVSELLGTMLLLVMAVSIFSVVSINVVSHMPLHDQPLVDIVGAVEANNVVITHRGGQPLSLETVVVLTIAGTPLNFTAENLLDEESKQDGFWTVGEIIIHNGTNLTGLKVEATVVDVYTETTLLMGILQRG